MQLYIESDGLIQTRRSSSCKRVVFSASDSIRGVRRTEIDFFARTRTWRSRRTPWHCSAVVEADLARVLGAEAIQAFIEPDALSCSSSASASSALSSASSTSFSSSVQSSPLRAGVMLVPSFLRRDPLHFASWTHRGALTTLEPTENGSGTSRLIFSEWNPAGKRSFEHWRSSSSQSLSTLGCVSAAARTAMTSADEASSTRTDSAHTLFFVHFLRSALLLLIR